MMPSHPHKFCPEKRKILFFVGGFDSSPEVGLLKDSLFLSDHFKGPRFFCPSFISHQGINIEDSLGCGPLWQVDKAFQQKVFNSVLKEAQKSPSLIILKLGAIKSKDVVGMIAHLQDQADTLVLFDPVLKSSDDLPLISDSILRNILDRITIDLLMPNQLEWEYLQALSDARLKNVRNVLLKGGHGELKGHDFIISREGDYHYEFSAPFMNEAEYRGTGCAYGALIAGYLGQDVSLSDACLMAYLDMKYCIKQAQNMNSLKLEREGKDTYPWPTLKKMFWNQIKVEIVKPVFKSFAANTKPFEPFKKQYSFSLYPIVKNSEELEKILSAQIPLELIQLRIKEKPGAEIEEEVKTCIDLAKRAKQRLIINDYWELAIKYGAFGVHLGFEDVQGADLRRLQEEGLALGVSSHSYVEAKYLAQFQPSYMALGPIYETKLKSMSFLPQGFETLSTWKEFFSFPLVAIGGINLDRYPKLLKYRPSLISVVRDITSHPTETIGERLNAYARVHRECAPSLHSG